MRLFLLLPLLASISTADNKFMNSVRNLTNTNNNPARKRSDNYDSLQKKFEKYLGECKGGSSNENPYASEQNYMSDKRNLRGFRYGNDGGTYPDQYGDRRNTNTYRNRGDNGNVDERLTNYGWQRERPRNNCGEQEQNERFDGNHGENFNYNRRNNNPLGPHDRSSNRGSETRRGGSYFDQNRNNHNANEHRRLNYDDYNREFRRFKRNDNDNDNCVSQCVFSYLELLDENRTPSETAVIKFLQENVSNDRERIQVIREARRCFAKLITTEDEDGCEFSKSLSKCLQLELE